MGLLNASRDGQIVFGGSSRSTWATWAGIPRGAPSGSGRQDAKDGMAIDPGRGFGQPIVERAGLRVENVAARLGAGEEPASVAEDFGLSMDEVEAVTRFCAGLARRAA